jgi:hypothetical protein
MKDGIRACLITAAAMLPLLLPAVPHAALAQKSAALAPTKYLRATADTIAVTVESRGQTIPFATAIHTLRQVTRSGRTAWELTYRWFGNDGSRTADTLWIDAATLLPIENRRHNGLQDAVTSFEASAVHTRYTTPGRSEQRADTAVGGTLYASGELEELIRSSPLALGYNASYTLYYGPPRRLARPATFKVVRSEVVPDRKGRPVDCWVVDAPLSEGLNTFYVSKADHRVVRLVNHEDPTAAFVFVK